MAVTREATLLLLLLLVSTTHLMADVVDVERSTTRGQRCHAVATCAELRNGIGVSTTATWVDPPPLAPLLQNHTSFRATHTVSPRPLGSGKFTYGVFKVSTQRGALYWGAP